MLSHLPVVAALLAFPCAWAAEGPVATSKTDAPAELAAVVDDRTAPTEQAALDVFVGNWRCSGKAATERSPDAAMTLTMNVKKDLGGRWLLVRTEEQKSKDNPNPTVTQQVWGYSREENAFVQNGADNHGGFHGGETTGWVGERLSWVVDTSRNAKAVKVKSTYTKQGRDLALEIALDPTGTGDGYRVVFEGVCKK